MRIYVLLQSRMWIWGLFSLALVEIPPLRDMTSLFQSPVLDRRPSRGSDTLSGSLSRSVGCSRGTYGGVGEALAITATDRQVTFTLRPAQLKSHANTRRPRCLASVASSASPDGDIGRKIRGFCSEQMAATSIPCGPALHMTQYPARQS